MSGIEVDGDRPAAAWVTALPSAWTTARERLVLMLLALDTYDREAPFTCEPSRSQLAAWAGEYPARITEAIAALEQPTTTRPALIEVSRRGRARNVYRLRIEDLWSGNADDNDRHLSSVPTDHNDDAERSGTADNNETCGPEMVRSVVRPSGPRPTPHPPVPTSSRPVTDHAREARESIRRARGRRA